MLNKEVCKKCWGIYWDGFNEKRWKEGMLYCYMCFHLYITEKPECPYKLEHLLKENQK
jgi:hypothetical protein